MSLDRDGEGKDNANEDGKFHFLSLELRETCSMLELKKGRKKVTEEEKGQTG